MLLRTNIVTIYKDLNKLPSYLSENLQKRKLLNHNHKYAFILIENISFGLVNMHKNLF